MKDGLWPKNSEKMVYYKNLSRKDGYWQKYLGFIFSSETANYMSFSISMCLFWKRWLLTIIYRIYLFIWNCKLHVLLRFMYLVGAKMTWHVKCGWVNAEVYWSPLNTFFFLVLNSNTPFWRSQAKQTWWTEENWKCGWCCDVGRWDHWLSKRVLWKLLLSSCFPINGSYLLHNM